MTLRKTSEQPWGSWTCQISHPEQEQATYLWNCHIVADLPKSFDRLKQGLMLEPSGKQPLSTFRRNHGLHDCWRVQHKALLLATSVCLDASNAVNEEEGDSGQVRNERNLLKGYAYLQGRLLLKELRGLRRNGLSWFERKKKVERRTCGVFDLKLSEDANADALAFVVSFTVKSD